MTLRTRMQKLRTLRDGTDSADPFHAPDTLPFRAVTIPVASGSDPDVIEKDDNVYAMWPECDSPCDDSPSGQCEYLLNDPDICIHCGKATGA